MIRKRFRKPHRVAGLPPPQPKWPLPAARSQAPAGSLRSKSGPGRFSRRSRRRSVKASGRRKQLPLRDRKTPTRLIACKPSLVFSGKVSRPATWLFLKSDLPQPDVHRGKALGDFAVQESGNLFRRGAFGSQLRQLVEIAVFQRPEHIVHNRLGTCGRAVVAGELREQRPVVPVDAFKSVRSTDSM